MKFKNSLCKVLIGMFALNLLILTQRVYADVISPEFVVIGGIAVLIFIGICIAAVITFAVLIIKQIKKKNDRS